MEKIVFKTFSSYVLFHYDADMETCSNLLTYSKKSDIPKELDYTYYNKPFIDYTRDRREVFILSDYLVIMFRKSLIFGTIVLRHQLIGMESFKILFPELHSEYITQENIKLLEGL